jgi:hypothetical protein
MLLRGSGSYGAWVAVLQRSLEPLCFFIACSVDLSSDHFFLNNKMRVAIGTARSTF